MAGLKTSRLWTRHAVKLPSATRLIQGRHQPRHVRRLAHDLLGYREAALPNQGDAVFGNAVATNPFLIGRGDFALLITTRTHAVDSSLSVRTILWTDDAATRTGRSGLPGTCRRLSETSGGGSR